MQYILLAIQNSRAVSNNILILHNSHITFRVRHSRGKMYIDHGRLSVCLSVACRIPTLLHGHGCNLGNGRGAL